MCRQGKAKHQHDTQVVHRGLGEVKNTRDNLATKVSVVLQEVHKGKINTYVSADIFLFVTVTLDANYITQTR